MGALADIVDSTPVKKAGFDPHQPRWPGGIPGIGGQWRPSGMPDSVFSLASKALALLPNEDAYKQMARDFDRSARKVDWSKGDSLKQGKELLREKVVGALRASPGPYRSNQDKGLESQVEQLVAKPDRDILMFDPMQPTVPSKVTTLDEAADLEDEGWVNNGTVTDRLQLATGAGVAALAGQAGVGIPDSPREPGYQNVPPAERGRAWQNVPPGHPRHRLPTSGKLPRGLKTKVRDAVNDDPIALGELADEHGEAQVVEALSRVPYNELSANQNLRSMEGRPRALVYAAERLKEQRSSAGKKPTKEEWLKSPRSYEDLGRVPKKGDKVIDVATGGVPRTTTGETLEKPGPYAGDIVVDVHWGDGYDGEDGWQPLSLIAPAEPTLPAAKPDPRISRARLRNYTDNDVEMEARQGDRGAIQERARRKREGDYMPDPRVFDRLVTGGGAAALAGQAGVGMPDRDRDMSDDRLFAEAERAARNEDRGRLGALARLFADRHGLAPGTWRAGPMAGTFSRLDTHPEGGIDVPDDLVKPTVPLIGQDGNAFSIIGRVREALRREGNSKEVIDAFTEEATSGDYDHVLQTAMAYVNEGDPDRLELDTDPRPIDPLSPPPPPPDDGPWPVPDWDGPMPLETGGTATTATQDDEGEDDFLPLDVFDRFDLGTRPEEPREGEIGDIASLRDGEEIILPNNTYVKRIGNEYLVEDGLTVASFRGSNPNEAAARAENFEMGGTPRYRLATTLVEQASAAEQVRAMSVGELSTSGLRSIGPDDPRYARAQRELARRTRSDTYRLDTNPTRIKQDLRALKPGDAMVVQLPGGHGHFMVERQADGGFAYHDDGGANGEARSWGAVAQAMARWLDEVDQRYLDTTFGEGGFPTADVRIDRVTKGISDLAREAMVDRALG